MVIRTQLHPPNTHPPPPTLGYLPNDSEVARYGARTTPVVVTAYSLIRGPSVAAQRPPQGRRWWAVGKE